MSLSIRPSSSGRKLTSHLEKTVLQFEHTQYKHPARDFSWISIHDIIVTGFKNNDEFLEELKLVVEVSVGKCCGLSYLSGYTSMWVLSKEELEEVYEYLCVTFNSKFRSQRFSAFDYKQLFIADSSHRFNDPQWTTFKEIFKPTEMCTWQSASETDHTSSMFKIDLK